MARNHFELMNDPMLNDAFVGPDTPSLTPARMSSKIQIDFSGFPTIVDTIYIKIASLDKNFRCSISKAMFYHYCLTHLMARVVAIRITQGVAGHDEKRFLDMVHGDLFKVPGVLDLYLRSIGEFTLKNGVQYRLDLPNFDQPNWGKIDATNHWQYAGWPSPQISVCRIQADINATTSNGPIEWDLPVALRPAPIQREGAEDISPGLPTGNLLGYKNAVPMTNDQKGILSNCGITVNEFRTEGPTNFKFNGGLMTNVGIRLKLSANVFEIAPGPYLSMHGSIGLALVIASSQPHHDVLKFQRNTNWLEQFMIYAQASETYDPRIVCGALFASFRFFRESFRFADSKRCSWAIYDWDEYKSVPDTWETSCNTILKYGNDVFLGLKMVKTSAYDRAHLVSRVSYKSVIRS